MAFSCKCGQPEPPRLLLLLFPFSASSGFLLHLHLRIIFISLFFMLVFNISSSPLLITCFNTYMYCLFTSSSSSPLPSPIYLFLYFHYSSKLTTYYALRNVSIIYFTAPCHFDRFCIGLFIFIASSISSSFQYHIVI